VAEQQECDHVNPLFVGKIYYDLANDKERLYWFCLCIANREFLKTGSSGDFKIWEKSFDRYEDSNSAIESKMSSETPDRGCFVLRWRWTPKTGQCAKL
jgi:hypothetical protein